MKIFIKLKKKADCLIFLSFCQLFNFIYWCIHFSYEIRLMWNLYMREIWESIWNKWVKLPLLTSKTAIRREEGFRGVWIPSSRQMKWWHRRHGTSCYGDTHKSPNSLIPCSRWCKGNLDWELEDVNPAAVLLLRQVPLGGGLNPPWNSGLSL